VARRLLFVVPWFLFPATTGGRIRTSQILRGMKGKAFEITLASPVTPDAERLFADDIGAVCDRFVPWPEHGRGAWRKLSRLLHIPGRLPAAVAIDRSASGRAVIARELAAKPDLLVVDFPHAAVLLEGRPPVPSVLFTHNVEAEIYLRQVTVARDPVRRAVWSNQTRKMERYEREALSLFDRVIAVSERDAKHFRDRYGIRNVFPIPTGVDLDFFAYHPPGEEPLVVFTGSMDWRPNQEGIEWLLREVWPEVRKGVPRASLKIIGRDPPARLVRAAEGAQVEFTGFVDDVRPHARGAAACVIPLLVGGGTRIKAYEAMAQGCPIVSTTIGMEGLPAEPDRHFLLADKPREFAAALLSLLRDRAQGDRIAQEARRFVEASFSAERVAREFERICWGAIEDGG
jgi:glycosyltransferase involved in cell wall biosynthesis